MKIQVIGIERKQGVFENKENGQSYKYDNLMLHGIKNRFDGTGQGVEIVKVPLSGIGGEIMAECGGEIASIIGHTISFETNRFGKVTDFEVRS